MFGRLLKHNFLDTWKEFCSLYGIIIVLGFLLGLSVSMQNQVFLSLMTILFSGSILAIAVLYLVYVLRISNTSVYGKQGYLTHSIPIFIARTDSQQNSHFVHLHHRIRRQYFHRLALSYRVYQSGYSLVSFKQRFVGI